MTLFLGGSRLTACAAFGPILDSVGLNVTVISYADRVGIGITGCPDVGPPTTALAGHVHAEVADLLADLADLDAPVAPVRPIRSGPGAHPSEETAGSDPGPLPEHRAVSAVAARNREVLAAVQVRRDRLQVALAALTDAAATPVRDVVVWRSGVVDAAARLRKVFADHVHGTEGADGFFAAVREHAPRLEHQARALREEHPPLAAALDDLAGTVASVPDDADAPTLDAVRHRCDEVVAAVDRHRHRGAALVLDAYNVDVSTGD